MDLTRLEEFTESDMMVIAKPIPNRGRQMNKMKRSRVFFPKREFPSSSMNHQATPLQASCTAPLSRYARPMTKFLLGIFAGIVMSQNAPAQDAPPAVTVDLSGKGSAVKYTLVFKMTDDHFEGATLKAGSKSISLGPDFNGFSADLKSYKIMGDKPTQVLVASAVAESDYQTNFLFGLVDGELKQLGRVEGQGEMTIPGNGTLVSSAWQGFWAKKERYIFGKNLELTVVPQEFYGVNVEGTVTETFAVYQKRDAKAVLANTRKGSKFKVLLWDPSSRKAKDDGEGFQDEWYLIQTETGFVGWVQAKQMGAENAELPWAG